MPATTQDGEHENNMWQLLFDARDEIRVSQNPEAADHGTRLLGVIRGLAHSDQVVLAGFMSGGRAAIRAGTSIAGKLPSRVLRNSVVSNFILAIWSSTSPCAA